MAKKTIKKTAKAGKSTRSTAKKVTFKYLAEGATEVFVAGDFNAWKSAKLAKAKNGSWSKNFSVKPGKYEYKFLVNGEWITDPSNTNIAYNAFGTANSVFEV